MPVFLLDVNALLAMAWSQHQHHLKVRQWFDQNSSNGWATCPITQCSFLRLSMNPVVVGARFSSAEASRALQTLIQHQHHVFWNDDLPALHPLVPLQHIQGHQQITDAYLLALCIHKQAILATLDRGLLSLATSTGHASTVALIPT